MNKNNFKNFWYYHRVKVIISIIFLIVILFIVELTGDNISNDVEIAYVTDGHTISKDSEKFLKDTFSSKIMDVTGDDNKEIAFIPLQGPRVDLEFVAEGSQIVLVDVNTLRKLINQGVFEPLDVFIDKYRIDISNNPEVNVKNKGVEGRTYAIPMKFIPLLLNAGLPADDYYLTIRVADPGSKTAMNKNKNARAIVETILQNY